VWPMSGLHSSSLVPRALAVAACLVGGSALAEEKEEAAPKVEEAPKAEAAPKVESKAGLPAFGMSVDAGVPDFLGVNVVYRPLSFLRLQGGPLTNGLGFGLRGGVSLVPFNFVVSPSLTVEYGHYFESDGRTFARALGVSLGQAEPALARLSYGFANAHVGLEMGSPERFQFFLRAGLTYLNTSLNGSGDLLEQASGDSTVRAEDLRLHGVLPSVKLGLLFFFG
jgi:hypothetical protein